MLKTDGCTSGSTSRPSETLPPRSGSPISREAPCTTSSEPYWQLGGTPGEERWSPPPHRILDQTSITTLTPSVKEDAAPTTSSREREPRPDNQVSWIILLLNTRTCQCPFTPDTRRRVLRHGPSGDPLVPEVARNQGGFPGPRLYEELPEGDFQAGLDGTRWGEGNLLTTQYH